MASLSAYSWSFYIKDELNDRYHEKADRICRINAYVKEPEKDTMKWAITPFPMAAALSKDYPEVEAAVRLWDNGKTMFKSGGQRFYENKIFYADSNLFRCLPINLLRATLQTSLMAPNRLGLLNHLR